MNSDDTLRLDQENPNKTIRDLKDMLREIVVQVIDERLQPVMTELTAIRTDVAELRTEQAATTRSIRVMGKKIDALAADVLDLRGCFAVLEEQLPKAVQAA